MSVSQNLACRPRPFPIVRLTVAAMVVNFLLGVLLDQSGFAFFAAVMYGLMVSEMGLLSVWAVLGRQPIWPRWLTNLAILAGLWAVMITGVEVSDRSPSLAESILRDVFALPMVFMVGQFPLWVLRFAAGWCMVHNSMAGTAGTNDARQFGVADLLVLTTAVALMLGLAQLGAPDPSTSSRTFVPLPWYAVLLAIGLAFAMSNAFLAIPCVWAGLRVDDTAAGGAGLSVYGVFLFVFLTNLVLLLTQGDLPPEAIGLLLVSFVASLSIIFTVLRLAHAHGYVLLSTWPKERRPEAEGANPFASTPSTAEGLKDGKEHP